MTIQNFDVQFKPLSLEQQIALVEECIYFEMIDRFYLQYFRLVKKRVINYLQSKSVSYDSDDILEFINDIMIHFCNNEFILLKKWLYEWKKELKNKELEMLPGYINRHAGYELPKLLEKKFGIPGEPPDEENLFDSVIDIEAVLEKQVKIEIIMECVSNLNPLERLVFKLHHYYFIDPLRISKMLHRKSNAIHQRYSKAFEKIKSCVKKICINRKIF